MPSGGADRPSEGPWWADPRRIAYYLDPANNPSVGMSRIDILRLSKDWMPRPDEGWLQLYLEAALASQRVCTRMHCATCGSIPFKEGVVLLASGRMPEEVSRVERNVLRVDHDTSLRVAAALARLEPPPLRLSAFTPTADPLTKPSHYEWAVMTVVHMLWMGGDADFETEIKPVLADTWAGYVVARVQAHHAAEGGHPDSPLRTRELDDD